MFRSDVLNDHQRKVVDESGSRRRGFGSAVRYWVAHPHDPSWRDFEHDLDNRFRESGNKHRNIDDNFTAYAHDNRGQDSGCRSTPDDHGYSSAHT